MDFPLYLKSNLSLNKFTFIVLVLVEVSFNLFIVFFFIDLSDLLAYAYVLLDMRLGFFFMYIVMSLVEHEK